MTWSVSQEGNSAVLRLVCHNQYQAIHMADTIEKSLIDTGTVTIDVDSPAPVAPVTQEVPPDLRYAWLQTDGWKLLPPEPAPRRAGWWERVLGWLP